jgi:CDP-diacylglycerol--glycerol-3-phosphate 3-phosphatidyltransferase
VNLPNLITLTRIGCVGLLLWILSGHRLDPFHGAQELAAAAIFLLAVISGAVDGRLARRTRSVTPLGTLLSPLAQKLLLASAFIALVRFSPELLPAWIAVVLVSREFLVAGLRAVAEQERMSLTIHDLGHGKTTLQTITVVALLMAHAWPRWTMGDMTVSGTAVAEGTLWLLLTLSVTSAAMYFRGFWMEALLQSRQQNSPQAGPAEGSSGGV